MPVKGYSPVGHVIKKTPSILEKRLPVRTDAQWKASVPRLILGTLRSETWRLLDAAGSKFSKRWDIAHAYAVVLMASRRVENADLAILTFCTKREYIPSNASVNWWYIPLNLKKWQSRIVGRNFWRHFRSRTWKDIDFFYNSLRCTNLKLIKWQRLRARLASSHELQLQILNAGVFCILSSSLAPLHFSIYCVHTR